MATTVADIPKDVMVSLRLITGMTSDAAERAMADYIIRWPTVPGAPMPTALVPADAVAAAHLSTFLIERDTDWRGLSARVKATLSAEGDASDVYQPNWYSKSEDNITAWVRTFGDSPDQVADSVDATLRNALASELRHASPRRNATTQERLETLAVEDVNMLGDMVAGIVRLQRFFVRDDAANCDSEHFRWGQALCFMAGLGLTCVRAIGSQVHDEADWDHWAHCDDAALTADIIKAHDVTGFPVGLVRVPFLNLLNLFSATSLPSPPWWFKACAALHLLNHTRIWKTPLGTQIFVAYRGTRAVLPVGNMEAPLSSSQNRLLTQDLNQILGFPTGGGDDAWQERAIRGVLAQVTPDMLITARDPTERHDLLIPVRVELAQRKERGNQMRLIDPGLSVVGVARVNHKKQTIETNVTLDGPDVINYQWPNASAKATELQNWKLMLPTSARPERASSVIKRYIRNIDFLGEEAGFSLMVDTLLTATMYRDILAGSPVGSTLTREFPPFFILPTGTTPEETTNQGKTNLGRIIIGAMVPGMIGDKGLRVFDRNPSAPAQRTMAEPLHMFGTALYDEFLTPASSEHFMSKTSLVSMITGAPGGPGLVHSNTGSVGLKHPLVLAAKFAAVNEDVFNRMAPIFLNQLTDETRCTDEVLNLMVIGTVPLEARVNHLTWLESTGMAAKLRRAKIAGGSWWRFDGHRTVASVIGGAEGVAALARYLKVSVAMAKRQYEGADNSGLLDDMQVAPKFDPAWYLKSAKDMTLEQLAMSTMDGKSSTIEVLKQLVEDNQAREFARELTNHRVKERGVIQLFINAIKADKMRANGYEIVLAGKEDDGHSRLRQCVIVRREAKKPRE